MGRWEGRKNTQERIELPAVKSKLGMSMMSWRTVEKSETLVMSLYSVAVDHFSAIFYGL